MGFLKVYDYAAGKKSWSSFGLPREGTKVPQRSAGDLAHHDVPTCALADRLAEVQERVRSVGWDTCIVVNEQRVVLGHLGAEALRSSADISAEEAMTPGPSTVRPSLGTENLLARMRARSLASLVVTTPDGRLVGLVLRSEIE
jgi:CBS domain-containing protein